MDLRTARSPACRPLQPLGGRLAAISAGANAVTYRTSLRRGPGRRCRKLKHTGLCPLRHFYASLCINRKVDGELELAAKRCKNGAAMPT